MSDEYPGMLELLFVTKNSITDTLQKKYLSTNAIYYCERQSGGKISAPEEVGVSVFDAYISLGWSLHTTPPVPGSRN